MKLGEAMRAGAATVERASTVADAARELRAARASAVVVTDDGGSPVGILTEHDIVQTVVEGLDPATTPAWQRMGAPLLTLPPSADLEEAEELMARHGIAHVPVVENGRLVGMLSLRDRARNLEAEPRRPSGDFGTSGVVSYFRGPYSNGPPAKDLEVHVPSIRRFGPAEVRRMVMVYFVLVGRIGLRLLAKVLHPRRRTWWEAASEGAVDAFERLGPTFVKLGQLIASSPGLFPPPLAKACERCLDDVPPFDGATARKMITADLGRPPSQIFKSFDDTPLSAASIGQVHACVLPDGRDAVIKLQRPNIKKRMTTDLRNLYRLARTLERHFAFAKNANAVAIVEDLHEVTFSELNPALEAWRQSRFRENLWAFGDNKFITAPEVYWDYCGPHMICMERMSGVPMDEFDTIRERGFDGALILRRGAKTWLEAVAMHGLFHGDMHAGNLWVLDDGRASYLDFGIMGELPVEYRELVKDLFYTFIVDNDFTRVARAYKRLGVLDDSMGSDEEVGLRLQMVISPLLGKVGGLSLADFLMSSLDMMKQFGASAPKETVLVSKQLLYMERYTKGLAPELSLATDPFLIKNIFPREAAEKARELGIEFPD